MKIGNNDHLVVIANNQDDTYDIYTTGDWLKQMNLPSNYYSKTTLYLAEEETDKKLLQVFYEIVKEDPSLKDELIVVETTSIDMTDFLDLEEFYLELIEVYGYLSPELHLKYLKWVNGEKYVTLV